MTPHVHAATFGTAERPLARAECYPWLRIFRDDPMAKKLDAAKAAPAAKATLATNATPPRRGRPPRRVYINVLVKASTREGLTRLKAEGELASQGEVIDGLVALALAQRAKRGA